MARRAGLCASGLGGLALDHAVGFGGSRLICRWRLDFAPAHANARHDEMKAGRFGAALLLASVFAPTRLHADGGVVCLHATSGPFRVTVFTVPAALRAGPVDLSVLVEDSASNAIMLDAAVDLQLRAEHEERALK